jgi:chromosome segregation ATPase
MLVERFRIQQTHVDMVNRRLDDLRTQVADVRAARRQMEQQIKDAEDLLERTTEPNGRLDLESRIKSMKATLARFGPEEERLRTRELGLESELQIAQVKLNELNGQLDVLLNEMKTPYAYELRSK